MISSEVDLRKSPHLRLLQFQFNLDWNKMRKFEDDVLGWFNAICESITSKSLVVEVCEFPKEAKICDKIQDTLLVLYKRIETFSVYLTPGTKEKGLFSKLYEAGIVVEKRLDRDGDEAVSGYLLISKLPY